MGLIAGPVPPRVDARVKAGLLDLLDHAVEAGWSTRRACALLGLDDLRAARWAADRRAADRLEDGVGGNPVIKRQMYGRAGFDLLRRRVLLSPDTTGVTSVTESGQDPVLTRRRSKAVGCGL